MALSISLSLEREPLAPLHGHLNWTIAFATTTCTHLYLSIQQFLSRLNTALQYTLKIQLLLGTHEL